MQYALLSSLTILLAIIYVPFLDRFSTRHSWAGANGA